MVKRMRNTSPRRLVASMLLGAVATSLAACGIAGQPMMSPATTGMTGVFARATAPSGDHPFNLKFEANRAPNAVGTGRSRAGIPASTDLRSKLSPVDDQGHVGSCTGFAMTGLAEYLERQQGQTDELSPGFVYLMELNDAGELGHDGGSTISEGIHVLKTYGICPEAMHPYISPADQADKAKISAYLSQMPSDAAMTAAKAHRVTQAKQIGDLDGFKTAIAAGKPVVFGIAVYSSFKNPEVKQTGVVPLPASGEQLLGGHAIVAVGYDDAKQQVTFRNSWSAAWGDKGYGYLPYGYFKRSLVHDAWQAN